MIRNLENAGLGEADFRLTCLSGFGDGWNHYAHSMAWFRDKLYVGTTRGTMAALRGGELPPRFRPWPVEAPDDLYEVPRRAEIWEYTPETDTWVRVYRSPEVVGTNGRPGVPSYIGYRGASVFQGEGDDAPCLYFSSWSPHLAHAPDILRSADGRNFAPVTRPPWGPRVRACRTLQSFKGRVHISPTASGGQGGFNQDLGSEAIIYASNDLRTGQWAPANAEGFGAPGNMTVFEMGEFDGHLYAGTVNPLTGGELWKTQGGDLPYQWKPVLTHGAWRGVWGEVAGAMCEFKGALYVGMGIVNGGYHRTYRIGPAAAEVVRVWPDDSWDLLVGDARTTPQGLKVPLSGMTSGFDSLFNGYVWRFAVHDGWLYAGTLNWANLLPYLPVNAWPDDAVALMRRWGEARLVGRLGGCELWRTFDGVHWDPVTRSGFNNKYNWGIRNFASTPHGLFVGTANPFGPRVAVKQGRDWTYVDNPRGGCEVWLGHQDNREPAA